MEASITTHFLASLLQDSSAKLLACRVQDFRADGTGTGEARNWILDGETGRDNEELLQLLLLSLDAESSACLACLWSLLNRTSLGLDETSQATPRKPPSHQACPGTRPKHPNPELRNEFLTPLAAAPGRAAALLAENGNPTRASVHISACGMVCILG